MAKAGKKRQQKTAPAHNKKAKHHPEKQRDTQPAHEIQDNQDHELEVEALLDDFEDQVRSSALEEAIREMKEGSASDSDSDSSDNEAEAMSDDDDSNNKEDGSMEVDERIPDTTQSSGNNKPAAFRDRYMAKVTQAFSSDLDKIRQEPNFDASQLTLLIDSLEAGIDIFSDMEKEIVMRQE